MARRIGWGCCLLLLGLGMPVAAQTTTPTDRTYVYYVPAETPANVPLPLLIVLHGRGGWGARSQGWLGFDALADEMGFMVVYPDGVENDWDLGFGVAIDGERQAVDDVGFITGLAENLDVVHPVDPGRVFVVGMSNGAMMAYRLACEAPHAFAGVAGVAATLPYAMGAECPQEAVSILMIHGTEDNILPWHALTHANGQVISFSAQDSMLFWALRNQCAVENATTTLLPDTDPDDGSTVAHIALPGCANHTEVHFYGVVGGGHTWPGRPFDVPLALGGLNQDVDASRLIAEWFLSLPNS